ncbi:MAG: glucose-1-phosphate thymidylyltransferase, partial [Bacteroidota bacterium]
IGADSNTSNLKTNYGLIYLEDWTSREAYPVGFQFFGSVLGDHSKTAINAMLNTGTMCGVCSNIFLSQFTPKHIPSFSWLTDHGNTIYRFDKAVEAMRAMMARRDVVYTEAYERMMRHLFEEQQHDKARA